MMASPRRREWLALGDAKFVTKEGRRAGAGQAPILIRIRSKTFSPYILQKGIKIMSQHGAILKVWGSSGTRGQFQQKCILIEPFLNTNQNHQTNNEKHKTNQKTEKKTS